MNTNSKKVGLAALLTLGLGGAWLGASLYGAQRAETELKALAARPAQASGPRLLNLQHQRGWLTSSGQVQLRRQDACHPAGASDNPVTLQLSYQLAHAILPGSLMRVQWTVQPAGDAGAKFAQLFGAETKLQGSGALGFGGHLHSSIALPELAWRQDGKSLQLAPASGSVTWGEKAFALDLRSERLVLRGHGQAFEAQQMALAMDLKNRQRGIGSVEFSVDKLSTGQGSAEGLRLASTATESGDRVDMRLQPSLKRISMAGQTAQDLALDLAAKGLHAPSLETILQILGEACDMDHTTADESQRLRAAVGTLLAQGFSVGVDKLAGKVGDGALDGQLTLQLRAGTAGERVALEKRLSANGQLTLTGSAVPPQQKGFVLAMGLAEEMAGGLKASFSYADGLLKANGRVFDGGAVQTALARTDREINGFLAGPRVAARPAAPAPAPDAPAPAPADSGAVAAAPPVAAPETPPATAPVAAPGAPAAPLAAAPAVSTETTCSQPSACLSQALRAAAREDLDALRAVATALDALPKPDLGNKAQARRHNNDGLDALKREDNEAAVAAFRRGQAENPRDPELAGNLGFALVRAGRGAEAVQVLTPALLLDPRRTSTWTPLAEALALAGRKEDALAALWVGYQWSGNREKAMAYYSDRAEKDRASRPVLAELYAGMVAWAGRGTRPVLATLAAR